MMRRALKRGLQRVRSHHTHTFLRNLVLLEKIAFAKRRYVISIRRRGCATAVSSHLFDKRTHHVDGAITELS